MTIIGPKHESWGVSYAGRYCPHDVRDGVIQKTTWNGYPCWGCPTCGYVGLTPAAATEKRGKRGA